MAECAACPRPVPDVAYVCPACGGRLAGQLEAAADLWPTLLETVHGQARMADPGPRPRGRAPAQPIRPGLGDPADDQVDGWPTGLPVNLHASDLAGDIQDKARSWARLIAEERYPWPPPAGPRCGECDHPSCEMLWRYEQNMPPPVDPPELLRWLAGQLGWCRYREWAYDLWDELGDAEQRITREIDRPPPRVDAGLCLAPTETGPCQQRLSAAPRAAYVHCPVCRATHAATDRSETILAGARQLLATAEDIATWLTIHGVPTTSSMVRNLAARRAITGQTVRDLETGRDRTLYVFWDVERRRRHKLGLPPVDLTIEDQRTHTPYTVGVVSTGATP